MMLIEMRGLIPNNGSNTKSIGYCRETDATNNNVEMT